MKVTDSICGTAPSGGSPGHGGPSNNSGPRVPDLDSVLLEMISAASACIPGCEDLVGHPELALEQRA